MKSFLFLSVLVIALGVACATIASAQDATQTNVTATATQSTNEVPSAATNAAPAQTTNAAPVSTAPPAELVFTVSGYRVLGNTLLSDEVLQSVFAKHIGTNMTIPKVQA